MARAYVIRKNGGPEVLKLEEVAEPQFPGANQLLIRHTAIGIHFEDINYIKGIYQLPGVPIIPGIQAVGVVEKVGPGVNSIKVGQRVVYCTGTAGAYCEKRLIYVNQVIGIPNDLSDEIVAASHARALLALCMLRRLYKVNERNTILVHSAAGGTGQFIVQMAKYLGARVIGTVGSDAKIEVAKSVGCDFVTNYRTSDIVKDVSGFTRNTGVELAYDSVGKDTFDATLNCVSPLGIYVSFGQSSGKIPNLDVLQLASRGIFLTRPTLQLYYYYRLEFIMSSAIVMQRIREGVLRVNITRRYNFNELPQAVSDLASGQTTGCLVVKV